MKKKTLRPQLTAPVIRGNTGSAANIAISGLSAQTYCDIATRECTPFAGDDAE
ncbi:MAG: anacyclamide/piricyclamide family prenylated cyclic peptide [Cyanobacteria bacterium J06633_8]